MSDVSVCYLWGALSHNDRPLWKALLPGRLVSLGLALPEIDVPLIELLFHSNCFNLLSSNAPSCPPNHNPIYSIFYGIIHHSCSLLKSSPLLGPCSHFFTWYDKNFSFIITTAHILHQCQKNAQNTVVMAVKWTVENRSLCQQSVNDSDVL